jgi:hypothetical protein
MTVNNSLQAILMHNNNQQSATKCIRQELVASLERLVMQEALEELESARGLILRNLRSRQG